MFTIIISTICGRTRGLKRDPCFLAYRGMFARAPFTVTSLPFFDLFLTPLSGQRLSVLPRLVRPHELVHPLSVAIDDEPGVFRRTYSWPRTCMILFINHHVVCAYATPLARVRAPSHDVVPCFFLYPIFLLLKAFFLCDHASL